MDWTKVVVFFGTMALGLGLLVHALLRTHQRSSENDSSVTRGSGNYPPDGHA